MTVSEYAMACGPDKWARMIIDATDQAIDGVPPFPDGQIQARTNGMSKRETMEHALPCFRSVVRILDKHLRQESQPRLLDFGCGWGRFLRYFLSLTPSRNLFGADVDEPLLSSVRGCMPYLDCRQFASGEALPFEDASFDVVFANSVFSHLAPDLMRHSLDEIQRCVRPGGLMILTTMGPRQVSIMYDAFADMMNTRFGPKDDFLARLEVEDYVYDPDNGPWEGYGLIFFAKHYIETQWGKAMQLVEVDDATYPQDIYTFRKLEAAL